MVVLSQKDAVSRESFGGATKLQLVPTPEAAKQACGVWDVPIGFPPALIILAPNNDRTTSPQCLLDVIRTTLANFSGV